MITIRRIFNTLNGVVVMTPTYVEALEKDTKRFYQDIEYFDCEVSELPLKKSLDGTCQRCHWKFDGVNKKIVIRKDQDCEHDTVKKIQDKINNPDKQIALDGLLEMERFKSRKVK